MSVAVAMGSSGVRLMTRARDMTLETPNVTASSCRASLAATHTYAGPEETEMKFEGEQEVVESNEESVSTPTQFSPRSSSTSSASSSPSISPSSSTSSDTSVASDTPHPNVASSKDPDKEHKAVQGENRQKNAVTSPTVPTVDPRTSADTLKYEDIATSTASASTSLPSTPPSSSTTSLPAVPPFSSSAPTSTSPSTTDINDPGLDSSGLLSLLRPRASFNQNMNVKFAPLPELAPRKRKSSAPLGMAARSQLARRRRMLYPDSYDDDYDDSYRPRRYGPPEISEGQMEGAADGGSRKKKAKKQKDGEDGEKVKAKEKKVKKEGEQSEAEEDPFAVLAKKMGKAGRQIWKKMASGGRNEKESGGEDISQSTGQSKILPGAPENPASLPVELENLNETLQKEVVVPPSEEREEEDGVKAMVLQETVEPDDQASLSPATALIPVSAS